MDKKYGASKSQEDRKNELDPDNGNFKAGKARRVASRKRRSEYGIGKKGRKAAAAAVAKEAAVDKLERLGDGASMFGGKEKKEKHKQNLIKEVLMRLKEVKIMEDDKPEHMENLSNEGE